MKNCYIHIPFCKSICSYCDFPKMYHLDKYVDNYLSSLEKEIKTIYKKEILKTLYIGGGTPSCLTLDELKKLFKTTDILKKSADIEFTFECNIENIDKEKLKLLYQNGVNRLSLGVQSFNKKNLKLLNRNHTKKKCLKIINYAYKLGYKNINIDLIYGIPGQSIKMLKKDLKIIKKLKITHISTYSLIIEKNTKLYNKKIENIDPNLEYKMYLLINKKLRQKNFIQYEISNYAKKGYESKHNLNYWNNGSYYGFGLGATSYINNYRITNTKNINNYLNYKFIKSKEYEDKNIQMSNELILGLRKIKGINKKEFLKKYGKNIEEVFDIKKLIEEQKLIEENDFIKINSKYLYVSNEILINFIL